MSIGTTVVAALSQIGTVEDVQRVRETNCGYFTPNSYPIPDGPTGARCSLNFIQRIEGESVIRIVLNSDCESTKIDIDPLLRSVSRSNLKSVFGSVALNWRKVDNEFEFVLSVSHSLSVRGLTEDVLVEVVRDLQRLWQHSMNEIRDTIQFLERKKANFDRLMAKELMKEASVAQWNGDDGPAKALLDKEVNVLPEIEALVGLQPVKEFAADLVGQEKLAELRRSYSLDTERIAPHLVFLGGPGTGKTTVARLMGRLYKQLGLLPEGHVVEVDRADLVGVYLGQTAIRTRELCEKALGGILFIDEAYSLQVNGRDYGDEALSTILTFMENNRGKLAVIVAGYPDQMNAMLDSNPGLRSRFDRTIVFENYPWRAVLDMFVERLSQQDYVLTHSALADVAFMLVREAHLESSDLNARSVRGFVDEVLKQHASMLLKISNPSLQQIRTITSLSIPPAWAQGRPLTSSEFEM